MKRRVLPVDPSAKALLFFFICAALLFYGVGALPFRSVPSVSVELATVCLFYHLRFVNLPVKATKIFSLKVEMGKIFLDPWGQP